ncbi:MAG: hypothetical protein ACE148_07455 [Vicinamibacterales bacterium]
MNRRIIVLLAILGAALAVLAWQRMPGAAQSENHAAAAQAVVFPAGAQGQAPEIPDVALEKLQAPGNVRSEPTRDLFRFQPKVPPASIVPARRPANIPDPAVTAGPPPPSPPPRITLKLIGIVERTARGTKLAVLLDPASGDSFYGAEGDIIDGRYRVVKIGVESVEMTHADGRGRQTIPLSGQ